MSETYDYSTWTDEALRREHDAGMFHEAQVGLTPEQEKRLKAVEAEMDRRDTAARTAGKPTKKT